MAVIAISLVVAFIGCIVLLVYGITSLLEVLLVEIQKKAVKLLAKGK